MFHTTKRKTSSVLIVVVFMLGMAIQGMSAAQTSSEPEIFGQPLGDAFKAPAQVQATQTRLVVYRPQASVSTTGVVRVYVNGSYHTALMPTSYSTLCLAPGPVKVDVRQVRRNNPQTDLANSDADAQVQLDGSKTVYLSVRMREGARYALEAVDSAVATQELKTTREQIHAQTRVADAQDCQDPAEVAVTPAVAPASSAQTSATSLVPAANKPQ
jgi:OOP family OmpA-OmpF porin